MHVCCRYNKITFRSTKFLPDEQIEYWNPSPSYFSSYLSPKDPPASHLHTLLFSALIPPLLSFLSSCYPLLSSSHTNCLSLWKLASLANPCSDRRAKCVLLTINITWDALKINAAPPPPPPTLRSPPCSLHPPIPLLFIFILNATVKSTVHPRRITLIGVRWGCIKTYHKGTQTHI